VVGIMDLPDGGTSFWFTLRIVEQA
jgi:hypothetical protein